MSYNPENSNFYKRILTDSPKYGKFYFAPTELSPPEHQTLDTRERIYILKNDPHKTLHDLLGESIVIYPIYSKGDIISQNQLEKCISYPYNSSIKVTQIIPFTSFGKNPDGFLYLGLRQSTTSSLITSKNLYFAYIEAFNPLGIFIDRRCIELSERDYHSLLNSDF